MISATELKKRRGARLDDILDKIEKAILAKESMGHRTISFSVGLNDPVLDLKDALLKHGYKVQHISGYDYRESYNYLKIDWD